MAKKRIALSTIVALLEPAALDVTICEMLTISAQTEQANSATRGRNFHLFVQNYAHPGRLLWFVESVIYY